jgi:hypothetical protein
VRSWRKKSCPSLPVQVRLYPDLTLQEHCELLGETRGVEVSTASMSWAPKRLWGYRSKKTLGSS